MFVTFWTFTEHDHEHTSRRCPDCPGRVRLIATIDDTSAGGLRSAGPAVIDKILRHLGLPVDPPLPTPSLRQGFGRQPARDPPWLAGALPGFNAGFAAGASPPDIWPH